MKRKQNVDYIALAKEKGFRWIGPEVPNVHIKTTWQCKNNHQWQARFNDINNGSGCPRCAGKAKKKPADYHELAKRRGFRWLGPEVPNNRTKTIWQCEKGHKWESRFTNIDRGQGCPRCAGKVSKKPEDYYSLAKEKGLLWLGPEVSNNQIKTKWKCRNGHSLEASYNKMKISKVCPLCYGNMPKKVNDYQILALKRDFSWLGPEVANTETKTKWKCKKGHIWEATYHNIRGGSGCPSCKFESIAESRRKTPRDYHVLAKERGFRWCGPEVRNNRAKTVWECVRGHRWESDYSRIQQGSGCPHCYGTFPKSPSDYQTLAKERGFKWLGPEVLNTKENTNWVCHAGHKWEAPYTTIKSGHGCPECSGLLPKIPNDYLKLAKQRKFRWLGPEVDNTKANTMWECINGHRWRANYHNIQSGTGCPVCLDFVHGQRVSKAQRKLCKILGGELNYPVGRYNVDIALVVNGVQIAVEYDSWFWHAHKTDIDNERDEKLINAGWNVLRIKTNEKLPNKNKLQTAISQIVEGKTKVDIILDDWGTGRTRFELE